MSREYRRGKGFGFDGSDGRIWMMRCFECGKENYGPAVASGQCAWCGHDPNIPAAQAGG